MQNKAQGNICIAIHENINNEKIVIKEANKEN